jgi:hypothetical protein
MSKPVTILSKAKELLAMKALDKIIRVAQSEIEKRGFVPYIEVEVGKQFAEIMEDQQGFIELSFGVMDEDSETFTIGYNELKKMHSMLPPGISRTAYHPAHLA